MTISFLLSLGFFLIILADLNSDLIWMVSILPLFSTSKSLFYRRFQTVPRVGTILSITLANMFYSFYRFLTVYSLKQQNSLFHKFFWSFSFFNWLNREYLIAQENFMSLIFKERFCFVHLPFGSMVKFLCLAQFQGDPLSRPNMPCLVFLFMHSLM